MPFILVLSESDHRNRPSKDAPCFGLGILEHDAHRMIVIVVFINDQKGPLAIRAQYCIGRYQDVAA